MTAPIEGADAAASAPSPAPSPDTAPETSPETSPETDDPRSFEEKKRRDQLTAAPDAIDSDADPRIDVTTTDDGTTRIDWRDDAPIKP